MTELRENCTWRRCSVSRARFRLKLYEPSVKCLGDVGPAEILGASSFARLKYFYPDAKDILYFIKVVLAYSSLISVRLYIRITLRQLACSSLFPRKNLSPCYSRECYISRDKSRSTSEVKSGNLQRLTSRRSYHLLPEGAIFLLYVFYIRQVYTWGATYMRPL